MRAAEAALLDAAAAGDEARVRELLAAGADPAGETVEGWTALIRASAGGHAAVVAVLLAAGAPPNPARANTHTALRAAALYGHASAAKQLLAARADPNTPSAGLRTPLMGACFARTTEPGYDRAGTLDVAALLLRARAAVDARNDSGETALALAMARADVQMAELLLAHGAATATSEVSTLTGRR
ncbi:hypothetical protein KFE25_009807 [Diacronema lutheri]|uniref:Ankyrin repeat domain-containing protein n=1 Tax=Diacronema lutheri TaxID=2081491 RepID=A0A8J5X6K9_DIALT|nr:hypothetical protein KFE25_009807 [Diacronema lutheri]